MQQIFDFDLMWSSLKPIISRLPVTMFLTLVSMAAGLVIALLCAFLKIYKMPVFRRLASVYISFIRGTPLLCQLFLIYYGIPKIIYGLQVTKGWFPDFNANATGAMTWAVIAFSINNGAYLTESIRSSIEAVDRGQLEAAYATGMTTVQAMKEIVLPQALLIAVPNVGNHLLSTFKGTSLASIITVTDLMGQAKIIGARNFSFFEVYVSVSIVYWSLSILMEVGLGLLERKLKVSRTAAH